MIKKRWSLANFILVLSLCACSVPSGETGQATDSREKEHNDRQYTQKIIEMDEELYKMVEPKNVKNIVAMEFKGFMQQRLENNMNQWMLPMYRANPAIIEMFRQRDGDPRPKIVAWYGEFPGKYITSAALIYRMNRDTALKAEVDKLVDLLEEVQDAQGYLGAFPASERIVGKIHPELGTNSHWDMWGHYHCILGLMMWQEETGSQKAYDMAVKAADYVIRYFEDTGKSVLEAGETEMNLSIIHAYTALYLKTKNERYLAFAGKIIEALEDESAGDYLRAGLAGTEYYQTNKPRWEGLHTLQAFCDLYEITGKEDYATAFKNLWWSILKTDRHNTGGFSSGEKAQGSPYNTGAIETCCTVAWIAMSIDMYHLTGSSRVMDEIELSTLNGVLGYMHPSGRWSTYNSPMVGVKKASAHDIVFQAIPGSPELNCCSVNAPRGFGMIADWAVTREDERLTLNYYGASNIATVTPGGKKLVIRQDTAYPAEGDVSITLEMEGSESFPFRLRIPVWSENTRMALNGNEIEGIAKGEYYTVEREWKSGDEIRLSLDMSLHLWVGEEQFSGSASLYRGPVLLTYDQRFNETSYIKPPALDLNNLAYTAVQSKAGDRAVVLLEFKDINGKSVYLCDYATAGVNGTAFNTWIPLEGLSAVAFSKDNPIWNVRQ